MAEGALHASFISFYILRASTTNSRNTLTMIAIIATVCLAASAANPETAASHGGRQLIGYTQSLGEPFDMVSYCKSGLKCTNGVFGTGKCVKGSALEFLAVVELLVKHGDR